MALEFLMGGEMILFFYYLMECWSRDPRSSLFFFALAGCPLVHLRTNESEGRHHWPFFLFNNFVVRSAGCGVHPKLKL